MDSNLLCVCVVCSPEIGLQDSQKLQQIGDLWFLLRVLPPDAQSTLSQWQSSVPCLAPRTILSDGT